MHQAQALDALSALANETRLQIVRLLVEHGPARGCGARAAAEAAPEGMPAGEIARAVAVSASRLSFHLSALEQAGLISAERRGRQVLYSVDRAAMGGLIHYLLNDCCRGDPQVSACCQRRAEGCPPQS
ncbi:ArsR/SmtB family transcription factor [Pseudooceanicola sp. 200-1SW]|uniref:ArsR/SmtB family transcription factor n=1 Tax=Pseudooceanicola sp. 200-1SW TaxID=3425949 RepID=UPI003D7FA8B0